jgi:tetraprenyl-beta-curcumene synthase
MGQGGGGSGRVALTGAFAGAARRYWLGVFPRVCAERRRREARVQQIPDPQLQRVVRDALHKWGNIEGATAFAAFVPSHRRASAARAMACFQAAYNYLDTLTELPNAEPAANGRLLHRALLVALDPGAPHDDYYARHHLHDDGGYLVETVDECRAALAELPCYAAVAPAARRAVERIVAFQSCNTGEVRGDHLALERWARAHTPPASGLRWWETAAAGGSSLGIYALIAAAARPRVSEAEIALLEGAYFPWIGALHSLLDNLVDVAEDYATGQRSLVGCYASSLDAAARMRLLCERALRAAEELPAGRGHVLILAAMASFYLSTPEASLPAARPVAQAVLDALGEPARLALLVFGTRARVRRLAARAPGASARRAGGAEVVLPARAETLAAPLSVPTLAAPAPAAATTAAGVSDSHGGVK